MAGRCSKSIRLGRCVGAALSCMFGPLTSGSRRLCNGEQIGIGCWFMLSDSARLRTTFGDSRWDSRQKCPNHGAHAQIAKHLRVRAAGTVRAPRRPRAQAPAVPYGFPAPLRDGEPNSRGRGNNLFTTATATPRRFLGAGFKVGSGPAGLALPQVPPGIARL